MREPLLRSLCRLAPLALWACVVPDVPLEGKVCNPDAGQSCLSGYQCIAGACVSHGGADAGPEACTSGQTRACASDVGECRKGTQSCQSGFFGPCEGSIDPATEICDGKDNDCDGQTDEPEHLTPSPCELQAGVCKGAVKSCVAGKEPACGKAEYGALFEPDVEVTCDNLDNNCDGQTDEGLDNDHDGWGVDVQCALGSGDCDDWDAKTYPGATEVCDGKANNCGAAADATFACIKGASTGGCTYSGCTAPPKGPGGTIPGFFVCDDKCAVSSVCQPPPEICNGLDDNCDGQIDEDPSLLSGATRLGAGQASGPAVAGRAGSFSLAYSDAAAVTVRAVSEPDNHFGAVSVVSGAMAPFALAPAHLVFAASDGVRAVRLQGGLPAGGSFLLSQTSDVLSSPVATASGDGASLAAGRLGARKIFLAKLLEGATTSFTTTDSASDASRVALATLGGTPIAIYDTTSATLWSWESGASKSVELTPTGLTKVQEPAGAGEVMLFTAEDSTATAQGRCVYVARTKSGLLAKTDAKPLFSGASSCGEGASLPALAQLSADTFLAAWREDDKDTGTGATLHRVWTVRVTWTGGAWKVSSPTGFVHATDATATVQGCAAASDGVRFMLLYATQGIASEVYARLDCPGG